MQIKDALSAVGLKQIDLARISGVSVRQINALCTGAAKLDNTTVKNALAISSALGVTIEELVGDDADNLSVVLDKEADDLPHDTRVAIIKGRRAAEYSGWARYPSTCHKLMDRIPEDWWDKYSAKHLGEVMRLLERAYSDGLDSHRLD